MKKSKFRSQLQIIHQRNFRNQRNKSGFKSQFQIFLIIKATRCQVPIGTLASVE